MMEAGWTPPPLGGYTPVPPFPEGYDAHLHAAGKESGLVTSVLGTVTAVLLVVTLGLFVGSLLGMAVRVFLWAWGLRL